MTMSPDKPNSTGRPGHDDAEPEVDLDGANAVLSEWAARSAADSETLIERFESMGYAVRGKSEEEIAQVLRRPPTRGASAG